MKFISLILSILIVMSIDAQVTKVSLQASGLTCSMCSNSINKALKTLDYILEVDANIKTYTFDIVFKPGADVDFDMIKTKVENAGFTVSSFIVTINFHNVSVTNNQSIEIAGKTFLFSKLDEQGLKGTRQVKILDKGFVSSKEYKINSFPILPQGTYHAAI